MLWRGACVFEFAILVLCWRFGLFPWRHDFVGCRFGCGLPGLLRFLIFGFVCFGLLFGVDVCLCL